MVYCHSSLLSVRDPLAQFEVEKREHEMKMHKMEVEMEEVFDMKVQEKLQKLKDIEADVREERGKERGKERGEERGRKLQCAVSVDVKTFNFVNS